MKKASALVWCILSENLSQTLLNEHQEGIFNTHTHTNSKELGGKKTILDDFAKINLST